MLYFGDTMAQQEKKLDAGTAVKLTEEENAALLKAQLELFRTRKMDFKFHMPLYGELTSFPVYMSQLLDILDETLKPFMIPGEEQIITKSMINNYVQKKVILPPVNKKYNKVHIIHLIAIGVLKQVISIEEITQIIHMQLERYPKISIAYNYFCRALEESLSKTFNNVEVQAINRKKRTPTLLSELVDSCLLTFAHRIYVKKALYAARPKNYDKRIKTPVKMIMTPKNFKEKNS